MSPCYYYHLLPNPATALKRTDCIPGTGCKYHRKLQAYSQKKALLCIDCVMELEIDNKNKFGKLINMWQLYNTVNKMDAEEFIRKISKYLSVSEKKSKTCQNLLNTGEAVLRRKFIIRNAYIKKKKDIKSIT